MSVGMNMPSFEEIMGFAEDMPATPEFLDALTRYIEALMIDLQLGQLGVQQAGIPVQMEELGVRSSEAAARQAEVDFRQQYELPFRREELENERLLAQLGLDTQEMRFENERLSAAEQLTQLRERGDYDSFQSNVARETALLNLAMQREQFAQMDANERRGSGQFTPRTNPAYGLGY